MYSVHTSVMGFTTFLLCYFCHSNYFMCTFSAQPGQYLPLPWCLLWYFVWYALSTLKQTKFHVQQWISWWIQHFYLLSFLQLPKFTGYVLQCWRGSLRHPVYSTIPWYLWGVLVVVCNSASSSQLAVSVAAKNKLWPWHATTMYNCICKQGLLGANVKSLVWVCVWRSKQNIY